MALTTPLVVAKTLGLPPTLLSLRIWPVPPTYMSVASTATTVMEPRPDPLDACDTPSVPTEYTTPP